MTNTLTAQSSDIELMAEYEHRRSQACGECIGKETDTPDEAVIRASKTKEVLGMRIIRKIVDGTNRPGTPVLATDAAGRLWIVNERRLPSYDDLKHAKEVLIGNDRWAAQLFPPADQHVNIHNFCLHLWCPLTGSLPWPNFGEGGTI